MYILHVPVFPACRLILSCKHTPNRKLSITNQSTRCADQLCNHVPGSVSGAVCRFGKLDIRSTSTVLLMQAESISTHNHSNNQFKIDYLTVDTPIIVVFRLFLASVSSLFRLIYLPLHSLIQIGIYKYCPR